MNQNIKKGRHLIKVFPFKPFSFFMSEVSNSWNKLLQDPNFEYVGYDSKQVAIIDVDRRKNEDVTLYKFSACYTVEQHQLNPFFLNQLVGREKDTKQLADYLENYHCWDHISILASFFEGNYYPAIKHYYKCIAKNNRKRVPIMKELHKFSRYMKQVDNSLFPIPNGLRDLPGLITGKLYYMADVAYQYEAENFEQYFNWGTDVSQQTQAVPSAAKSN